MSMTNGIATNPLRILEEIAAFKAVIAGKKEQVNHATIVDQLIEQCKPLDFKALAFPKAKTIMEDMERLSASLTNPDGSVNKDSSLDKEREEYGDLQKQLDKMVVKEKHYLVVSIENILQLAKTNSWGLCKNHDSIYLFNGAFWLEIDKEAFQSFLGEAAERMGVERITARHFQFREKLFKQFLATAYLPSPENNQDAVQINLQNGTLEISQQGTKLRAFDSADFITYQLPFAYDTEAKAPLFETYLNKVLPDPDSQKILAEYLGYVFIKHGSKALKEEKALVLYGTGANGKSVFYETVSAMLGDNNVSTYSLQSLTNETGYYRAKLANKLVNYASEINGRLETATFKQLVSGEPVEARLPYGQPFTLRNYAKLIFNCNELPKDVEHSHAFFRRFLIVPFNVTIPPHEQDKALHTKIIKQELAGVLNWVLLGLGRLLEQGKFSECRAVEEAVAQYKTESNSVSMFLQENQYVESIASHKSIKELYVGYRHFCNNDGMTPFNKKNFIKQLRDSGLIVRRGAQNQLVADIEVSGELEKCFV